MGEQDAKAIWKFAVELAGNPTVRMPAGAQPLHFSTQDGQPTLWALVAPGNPIEDRHFRLFGTGHSVEEEGLAYIGTCFHGPFVWHLFEAAP